MKSLNPVDRALAAAFVCSGAAYAQALENPDTDWRQLTPEEDAAARDLIQSKGQQGLIIDALKHCPKIVGLALAENPLTFGADDGRAGALGSWLGQSLMASAPRLVSLSQKSSSVVPF